MSVYIKFEDAPTLTFARKIVSTQTVRQRVLSQFWLVATYFFIFCMFALLAVILLEDGLKSVFHKPLPFALSGIALLYFSILGAKYKKNPTSLLNKFAMIFLTVLFVAAFSFYTKGDYARSINQTGFAFQQCFGPAAAAFKSASIPQLSCIQNWGTPFAIIERRKLAEANRKECLKQDDEQIAQNISHAISQLTALDRKERALSIFRSSNITLSTADGRSYFANIFTHCLDGLGFDKNSQFKVVVVVNFNEGDLLKDIVVSSSNASPYSNMLATNGVARSYRVDFDSQRS